MTRSGSSAVISLKRAVLKELTRGFGGASVGGVKYAVTPTTSSHAPRRQSQSAASAERQTMRRGDRVMTGDTLARGRGNSIYDLGDWLRAAPVWSMESPASKPKELARLSVKHVQSVTRRRIASLRKNRRGREVSS